jgi:ferredoxin
MAFVITRLCRDCVDGACVDECPVDCILEHRPSDGASELPNQLFIDPAECIDCRRCEPACPWEAIFDELDVPAPFHDDIALNARAAKREDGFDVPVTRLLRGATKQEVERNRAKWLVDAAPLQSRPSSA